MRLYETIFIAADSVSDENVRDIAEKAKGIIERLGGKMVRTDFWGRRTMAYEINKKRRGTYVLLVYGAGSEVVAELERNLTLNESLIRFHTVKTADEADEAALQPQESKPGPVDLFAAESAREYGHGAAPASAPAASPAEKAAPAESAEKPEETAEKPETAASGEKSAEAAKPAEETETTEKSEERPA